MFLSGIHRKSLFGQVISIHQNDVMNTKKILKSCDFKSKLFYYQKKKQKKQRNVFVVEINKMFDIKLDLNSINKKLQQLYEFTLKFKFFNKVFRKIFCFE